jgi:hypothetical protein
MTTNEGGAVGGVLGIVENVKGQKSRSLGHTPSVHLSCFLVEFRASSSNMGTFLGSHSDTAYSASNQGLSLISSPSDQQ